MRDDSNVSICIDVHAAILHGNMQFCLTEQGDWVSDGCVPPGCIVRIYSIPDATIMFERAKYYALFPCATNIGKFDTVPVGNGSLTDLTVGKENMIKQEVLKILFHQCLAASDNSTPRDSFVNCKGNILCHTIGNELRTIHVI